MNKETIVWIVIAVIWLAVGCAVIFGEADAGLFGLPFFVTLWVISK